MHITLKWTLFFLACAVATGAVGFSSPLPIIKETAEVLCLISVVLVMFFAVAYSLREEKPKSQKL